MTGPRCDVVVTRDRSVYINGVKIDNLLQLNVDRDLSVGFGETRLTIEVIPTSIVFGDVPNETVDALAMDQDPAVPSVDINRAISRAQARAAGLDPFKVTQPAPAPAPVTKKAMPKKASYAEAAEPMDMDMPEEACGHGMGGGDICYRPRGHAGSHRS